MADELLQSEMILYQSEDGRTHIQCRFENEMNWLTQALIAEGELDELATCKDYLQVRREGERDVSRTLRHDSPATA